MLATARPSCYYLGAVVHAGAEIVGRVECDHLAPGPPLEVVQLAGRDVARMYDHVDVAVWTTLFVPEPDCVSDLVRYRSVLYSTTSHVLLTDPCPLSSGRQHLSYGVCLEVRGEIIRTV